MDPSYFYPTRWGKFAITLQPNGRWLVKLDDDNLGSYHSPQAALDDLLGDHCWANSKGLDTSEVGLPDNLLDWHQAA